MKLLNFRALAGLALAAAFGVLAGPAALAHGLSHKPGDKVETRDIAASDSATKAREYFTDTLLTSHTGEKLKFSSDVL
ncbi:MAG: hypothetical protein Q8L84_05625, partial [Hyphomonas sp.]|nr:hypothetical protein [Hyphomonas sp.]